LKMRGERRPVSHSLEVDASPNGQLLYVHLVGAST
jgi:hypothetical protein